MYVLYIILDCALFTYRFRRICGSGITDQCLCSAPRASCGCKWMSGKTPFCYLTVGRGILHGAEARDIVYSHRSSSQLLRCLIPACSSMPTPIGDHIACVLHSYFIILRLIIFPDSTVFRDRRILPTRCSQSQTVTAPCVECPLIPDRCTVSLIAMTDYLLFSRCTACNII